MIEWSKLQTYQSNKYKSFEQLCYQIAKTLYGQMGRFTPIDDSGGGDGVEFYLTLPNGDQLGWQAKFYYPQRRLSYSNRKTSIKNSLTTACQTHPSLKKWILCTPTDFTLGERAWFDNALPESIPEGKDIELEHWPDSDFNNWLRDPRFSGMPNYFFGELELDLNWFRAQVETQIDIIRDRFIEDLHVETNIDDKIHALLGDEAFIKHFTEQVESLENELAEYQRAFQSLINSKPYGVDWGDTKVDIIAVAEELQDALTSATEQLKRAINLLSEQRLDDVRLLEWASLLAGMEQVYNRYREKEAKFNVEKLVFDGTEEQRERFQREIEQIVYLPIAMASDIIGDLHNAVSQLSYSSQPDFHILGKAGIGKTHIASHICHERLQAGLPAILLFGRSFTSDQPLQQQLLYILDIPSTYSWDDFLGALESVAEAYNTRIPLIIDGLNEATRDGRFSDVWRLELTSLVHRIAQRKNVLLITTCRTTYKDDIWPDCDLPHLVYADGFDEYDTELAIKKYFSWYKIRADLTEAPLHQFQHPIYLKIFCESQNPTRQEEKQVYVGDYSLFEVFDKYLEQCNRAICSRLGLYNGTLIVERALSSMAQYLWNQRSRQIPLDELVMIVDGQPLGSLNWQQSKTKTIVDEGLLVCRDLHEGEDVVYFTYDLLGGYLIAKHLIQQADSIAEFIRSEDTIARLFTDDKGTLHVLYSDIGRCLAALLPMETGQYLHELTDNEKAFSLSIDALFELPPVAVNESSVNLVKKLFNNPQNRYLLLELSMSTMQHVGHPFDASFWSDRLWALSMPERDISWTEYLRSNSTRFEKLQEHLEGLCRSDETLSPVTEDRIHLLARMSMLILTSTVRSLRDKATRALYWYGRCMPQRFFDLVALSLSINDPYVPERMLAATYGIAMACQFDFADPGFTEAVLPSYGSSLYDAMFKANAPHSTTHILARDYARRTIDIASIHHPDLLTEDERKRITPPFKDGGIRKWGQSEDRNNGEYRVGNAPIQMDFENYTIGRLVEGRRNYDMRHEEYKTVRANIFWRIYDLGYSLETFGEIDKSIVHQNLQYGREENRSKTERYGKKYSWIAFYELAGFRQDQDSLGEVYADPRISDADIDPSFPNSPHDHQVIDRDLLGDRDAPLHEWIENGNAIDISSYLVLEELCSERGPWVLLDGYICQEDLDSKRSCFVFPRGLLIRDADLEEVVGLLQKKNIGARWLPEIPEDYYTYAGEIPWCDTFYYNNHTELNFVISTKKVIPSLPRISGKEIPLGEQEIEVPDEQRTFKIFLPVRLNSWSDFHSAVNPHRCVRVLAKELAEFFDLCSQPQNFDLYEKNGKRASFTIRWGDPWHTEHHLIYLRQDLLDLYLSKNNLWLVWAVWGERQFKSRHNEGLEDFATPPYKTFQEIIIKSYEDKKHC